MLYDINTVELVNNERNAEKKLRMILLACCELDIDEATCYFSTQNDAFLFEGKPCRIRVSLTSKKTRADERRMDKAEHVAACERLELMSVWRICIFLM